MDQRSTSVWVAAVAIGAASIASALVVAFVPDHRFGLESALVPLAGCAVALALLRRRRVVAAGSVVLGSYLAGVGFGLLRAGTLLSPGSSLLVLAILFGGLLLGARGALATSALVGALLFGLDALFDTPLGRGLRVAGPEPSVFWWLPLPFLMGVLVAVLVERMLHSADTARRSEAQRLASEERYRAVVENAPLGVVLVDTELRLTGLNPEACRMVGIESPEKMLGRSVRELPVYGLPRVREAFEVVLERGESIAFDAEWTGLYGKRMRTRLYGAPLRDAAARCVGAVVLMADTSEQRRLEEQLFQAQKLEAVGRLAGGVAHDFNNHLTVILASADVLSRQLGPEFAAELGQISAAATRSAGLTRQLLALGRRQILQPKLLSLNAVVGELDPLLRRTLGAGVEIETVLAAGLWNVQVDLAQIQTALLNLATNARDAMDGRGKLTIETANVHLDRAYVEGRGVPPGQYVMLAVTDDGAGMDEETRAQVFEPFFTTKPPGAGTGLGLSTAHGLVRQSGGLMNVYSEPGQGATFRIYLPRALGALAPEPERIPPRARGGSEWLLVAEDDAAVRATIARSLREAGYQVLEAADGETASELAAQAPELALLVTDLVMPRAGGVELSRRLREKRPGLRVLYLSGYAENGALRRAGLERLSSLLPKPFSTAELLARVRELLDGPAE